MGNPVIYASHPSKEYNGRSSANTLYEVTWLRHFDSDSGIVDENGRTKMKEKYATGGTGFQLTGSAYRKEACSDR